MRFSLHLIIGCIFLCTGCNYYMPNPDCPPPPSARPPNSLTYSYTQPTVAPFVPAFCEALSLADLVDIGLQNSPRTRAAWYVAKQAAADVGSARGAYLPSWDLQGLWLKEQFPQNGFDQVFTFREKILGFTFSTNYLLFDFGGRNGNLRSAIAALDSLCWTYNWEVQTVMSHVIQSYYNYIYSLAIVAADEATVEDYLTTLEAATARRIAGISGLSDELQAKTSLVQAQINLEEDRGHLNIALVTLVQSLGLPPDTPICVTLLPDVIASDEVCENMAYVLQAVKEHRSDLNAQRAVVLNRRFNIRTAKSALLPNITTEIIWGKQSIDSSRYLDSYSVQFNLNVPVFHSFADINALRKAQAALLEAQANLDNQELSAFLAALADYYELTANKHVLKYSGTYTDVATENQLLAFGNYKAGLTSIIDLMVANNALNTARRQLILAKANFLTSLANFAYDTGSITIADLCLLRPEFYPPWTPPVSALEPEVGNTEALAEPQSQILNLNEHEDRSLYVEE